MLLGDVLKYWNGLFIKKRYETRLAFSTMISLTGQRIPIKYDGSEVRPIIWEKRRI
jgi:hypothetical protein